MTESLEESSVDRYVLSGATIVLGVTGGIAAYKSVELLRRLMDLGAYVIPVMTENATKFIGATTLSALASEPARISLFDEHDPILHTRLGQSADLIVVAPATARLIGEYANGIAADLLSTTLIATEAPIVICPAMHSEMWSHPAIRENVATLERRGVMIVPPELGRLAGGDIGAGRLADIDVIVDQCARALAPRRDLSGCYVVVSAGGTREAIDPVRYLSNRSSGKQGYALAEAARSRGARVTLVTTTDRVAPLGVEVITVESAEELFGAVTGLAQSADVVIMAAAVADFRPVRAAEHKLKKSEGIPEIDFVPTPDTLAELGRHRRSGQVIVGFAAETDDIIVRAEQKLRDKGVDLLVVNDVLAEHTGFNADTNAVTILSREGKRTDVALAPKSTIAHAVLDAVVARIGER
ncbi:MAG TPA: bifunctional phosphopantothenoylcysteine decarboxylase/phosphopantothenate--cysteine ligase CoaBC [Acidimicrobiales bacterium]|nr:bifunctional phosphopantothenoylcysteine decarboxylase/phosphopantothenate--cysteine ligase CoaBC [Acidimicrobiales bacterium]